MLEEDKKEIQDAFANASLALRKLEEVIRKHHNTPKENLDIKDFNKILVPANYIRTKYYFTQEYKLYKLIADKIKVDSIAYALMQSDFHNYILNRVHIWGIVQGFFFKAAIINLVSIIEALLICSIAEQHKFCTENEGKIVCKYNSKCEYYIRSTRHMKLKEASGYFYEKYASQYSEIYNDLIYLNEIRNNVHISILDKHEFESTDYCFATYNKAIRVLLFLKEHQLRLIEEFHSRRLKGCLITF